MHPNFHFSPTGLTRHLATLCRVAPSVAVAAVLGGGSVLAAPDSSPLVVEASGFRDDTGQAITKLFTVGDNVLKTGRRESVGTIHGGQTRLTFSKVPAGEYAVVVFHDANANGVIDHNLFGLPAEALGFSNGFSPSLTKGLPSFEKLRFIHGPGPQTIAVEVK